LRHQVALSQGSGDRRQTPTHHHTRRYENLSVLLQAWIHSEGITEATAWLGCGWCRKGKKTTIGVELMTAWLQKEQKKCGFKNSPLLRLLQPNRQDKRVQRRCCPTGVKVDQVLNYHIVSFMSTPGVRRHTQHWVQTRLHTKLSRLSRPWIHYGNTIAILATPGRGEYRKVRKTAAQIEVLTVKRQKLTMAVSPV